MYRIDSTRSRDDQECGPTDQNDSHSESGESNRGTIRHLHMCSEPQQYDLNQHREPGGLPTSYPAAMPIIQLSMPRTGLHPRSTQHLTHHTTPKSLTQWISSLISRSGPHSENPDHTSNPANLHRLARPFWHRQSWRSRFLCIRVLSVRCQPIRIGVRNDQT